MFFPSGAACAQGIGRKSIMDANRKAVSRSAYADLLLEFCIRKTPHLDPRLTPAAQGIEGARSGHGAGPPKVAMRRDGTPAKPGFLRLAAKNAPKQQKRMK
jgi:hypothetical protein